MVFVSFESLLCAFAPYGVFRCHAGMFCANVAEFVKKMVVFSLSLHLISRNFTLEKEHAAGWHLLAYGCISLNLITKRYEV